MNKFSSTSKKRLETCHSDIQLVMNTAIAICPVDFGIAEGHRSVERQKKLFDQGKSKIDGITVKGKHNYYPSLAVDVYAYVNHKASWEAKDMIFIAGFILAVAEVLFEDKQISSKFRWGGNWDKDGEILSDQSFDDMPHFEIINYEKDND